MFGGLVGGLVVGSVLAVFALLQANARRPAPRDKETGELVLQCSPVLVWSMGAIAVGGPLIMAILSLVVPFEHPSQAFIPAGLGGFFLLLGGLLSYWAAMRRTRLNEKGLTSEYMFGGPKFLRWEDVERVTFASGQEFWVRGRRHKAMLHVWFVGVRDAVGMLYEHLPEEVIEKGSKVLAKFAMVTGADAPR